MSGDRSITSATLVALFFWLPVINAEASTFVLTKEADDDGTCTAADCALREAVLAANASPGMDTIVVPGGTYQLSLPGPSENLSMTGDLDIRDDVEILGDENAMVTIVGDGTDRVIQAIDSVVTISRVTLTGGVGISGGGISTSGASLTILNSIVYDNNVSGAGGGILAGPGNVSVVNTTIFRNSAAAGGGIARVGVFLGPLANLDVANSTISGNSADGGGGIYSQGTGELNVTSSTVAGNIASTLASAILSEGAVGPFLANTIIVGDCGSVSSIDTTSLGGNLQSPDASCNMLEPSDRFNVPDMRLGPLADNGGPTPTHALLPGSPAIDAALDANCPADDQRGLARLLDGNGDGTPACDAGAVEFDPLTLPINVPALDLRGLLALCLLTGTAALVALRQRWSREA